MALHLTHKKHRILALAPQVEALEGRWVPATTGTSLALPTATVLAQNYTNTGTDINASSYSEAGGYTFAQRLRITVTPSADATGGAFTPNDALNQFFDALMAGVDAYRGGTLFGGAYDTLGVGANGAVLPSAMVDGMRFSWQGDTLAFSETFVSGSGSRSATASSSAGRVTMATS